MHNQGYIFLQELFKFFDMHIEKGKGIRDEIKKINVAIDNKMRRISLSVTEMDYKNGIEGKGKEECYKNLVNPFLNLLNCELDENDNEEGEQTNGETVKEKEKLKENPKELEIWNTKVMRFLVYCINGGLSDYLFTFDKFMCYLDKCGNRRKYFDKFVWGCLGMVIKQGENDENEQGTDSKDLKPDF